MIRTIFWYAVLIVFIGAIGSLVVIGAEAEEQEVENWHNFAAQHCKVIGKSDGQSFTTTGFSTSGHVVFGSGSTSDQTEYQCDDGVTYWKDY